MPYDDRRIDRLIRRTSARPLLRSDRTEPEAARRIAERGEGPVLTRAPKDVEVVARDASDVHAAASRDLRSEIARQVAELVTLSSERGLLREGEAPEPPAAAPSDGAKGAGGPFQEWYAQLAASGLKDPEIEEIMLDRLRGLRRSMLSMSDSRRVGR